MARRSFRIAFEILAGLVAGMAIIIGVGLWRLSTGPINLAFLTPYVEEAINSQGSPVHVKIEDTVLTWGGWERAVDIVARNVEVAPAAAVDRPVARLPEVSFTLSLRALTQGVVAPTTLEILRPTIAMRRLPSGALGLTFAPSASGDVPVEPDEMTPVDRIFSDLQDFLRPPQGDHLLGYLTRLSIYSATGRFRDYHSGKNWRLDNVTFDLTRDGEGVEMTLLGQLAQGPYTGAIKVAAAKPFASGTGVLTAESPGLHLGLLQGLVPGLEPGGLDKDRIAVSAEIALREDGVPLNWSLDATSDSLGNVTSEGVTINSATGRFQTKLSVENLSPAQWARLTPALARAKAYSGALTADLSVTGSFLSGGDLANIQLDEGRLSLVGDAGSVNIPELYPQEITHNGLTVEARFADGFDRMEASQIRLDLPEGLLVAGVGTDILEGQRRITASARLTDFDMAYLDKYWPPELGQDARVWVVKNITEGPVSEATLDLDGSLNPDGEFVLRDMGGEITLDKGVVHYFRPLPPATNVSGVARFGPDWFDIDVGSGDVGNIKIKSGKIKITEIGTEDLIDIDLAIDAPFREALELVDHDPLNLVSGIGFDPATLSGQASGRAKFNFPLLNDLKAEEVQVQVDAQLTDLVMEAAFKDLTARGRSLEMSVNNDGFQVAGEVTVADVPLLANWEENFSDREKLRKRLTVKGRINETKLAEIGYNLIPYLDGETDIDLESREYRGGRSELDLSAGLTDAGLLAPPLNWLKPRTYPANLKLSAKWTEGGPVTILPVEFQSDSWSFKGSAKLADDQETIQQVLVEEMSLNGAAIDGSAVRQGDGKYIVDMRGEYIDVSGIIDQIEAAAGGTEDGFDDEPGVPFVLNSHFGVVTAGPSRRLLNTRLSLQHNGDSLQYLDLEALAKDGSPLTIRYGLGDQGYVLNGTLSNAGSALRSVDAFDGIKGGRMMIQGLRPSENAPLTGRVEMTDFVLVKAPAMAKVLEFMSLTGTLNALTSEGLPFSNLQADYSLKGSTLTLKKAKVFGASVGVSLSGDYDIKHDRINASGTVVPAYAINRAIGAIPLVGWLLTGGEDGGLFGANYSVSGPLRDPNVQVNPLSALTPGALRRLFDIFPNNPALDQDEKKGGEEIDPTPPPENKR